MAKKVNGGEGLQEDRTRVTLFLPTHKTDDIRAVRLINGYLHKQRNSKTCKITGFTTSVYPDCAFWGVWWSSDHQTWVPEKVTLVFIDYAKRLGDVSLENALRRLKKTVHESYDQFNRKQEVIWITASPVFRFT